MCDVNVDKWVQIVLEKATVSVQVWTAVLASLSSVPVMADDDEDDHDDDEDEQKEKCSPTFRQPECSACAHVRDNCDHHQCFCLANVCTFLLLLI